MGKKQHQKDKLYLTTTEWREVYGGRSANQAIIESQQRNASQFRKLRYDHCALSLQPVQVPYCLVDETTNQAVVYDLEHILKFIKKYKVDPATGKKIDAKALIKLNYHKNTEGEYHCPILYKQFNENTHIVAIKKTGNVFSYEAVEQLNIKANNYRDLLTDEQFVRKDIITIQDPHNIDRLNLANFHHIKKNLKISLDSDDDDDDESGASKKDKLANLKNVNRETRETLKELAAKDAERESVSFKSADAPDKKIAATDKFTSAHYSTGMVAAGITSTVMEPKTQFEAAALDMDKIRYSRIKKKGYVQIQTNLGPLNFELYCNEVPKACENFMKHCKDGYYDGTPFHRSIKNFMIQGGDPTGTGRGGQSIWGKPFEDEFKPNLVHAGRGILSMANSGPNTNKSQFFITYRSCRHLDQQHTVFGKLVGGMETLDKMERIKTDKDDRPLEEIKIVKCAIFVDPYKEVDEQIDEERRKEAESQLEASKPKAAPSKPKPLRSGVGAFIDLKALEKSSSSASNSSISTNSDTGRDNNKEGGPPAKKVKHVASSGFGDFSSW